MPLSIHERTYSLNSYYMWLAQQNNQNVPKISQLGCEPFFSLNAVGALYVFRKSITQKVFFCRQKTRKTPKSHVLSLAKINYIQILFHKMNPPMKLLTSCITPALYWAQQGKQKKYQTQWLYFKELQLVDKFLLVHSIP